MLTSVGAAELWQLQLRGVLHDPSWPGIRQHSACNSTEHTALLLSYRTDADMSGCCRTLATSALWGTS